MKNLITYTAALASVAGLASAGGLDRSGQQVRVLFEEGNRAEFSLGYTNPDLSGSISFPPGSPVAASGDVIEGDTILGFAYKRDIDANSSFAVIIDEPYGANLVYPDQATTGYAFGGSTADVNTLAITALYRYKFGEFSVYGGPRMQSIESSVAVPIVSNYTLDGDKSWGYGYSLGAAYEKPDIALRVALTYHSGVDHDQDIVEFGAVPSTISFTTPQAVNLDFQTGIMADTLLFGSVRWVEWSAFEIAPAAYSQALLTGLGQTDNSLLRYQDDRITYSLGVGRRFTENWSGAITAEYEPSTDEITTDLGPADGRTGVGLAVTYRQGDMDITGGLRYNWIGDATSRSGASFTDNSALSFGVRIGMKI